MQAEKLQFTAAAVAAAAATATAAATGAAATAAAATSAANTEKFVADYLFSNHCQNNKDHLITKMTVLTDIPELQLLLQLLLLQLELQKLL
jgi:predicted transglutaminase-like cysteine proteinase